MCRNELLSKAPVDITPKNGQEFIWAGKDLAKFEQDYSMKPVALKGVMDFDKEFKVVKY
jgi:hypothetical protein